MWRLLLAIAIVVFVVAPLVGTSVVMAVNVASGALQVSPDDRTVWPTVIGVGLILLLATYASWRLFRSWRAGRAVKGAQPQTGLWERLATRFPDALDVVGPFTLNGFGIRYLDFHGVEPDGSGTATLWLVAGFLPIAPLRRDRIRVVDRERAAGIPLAIHIGTVALQRLERMPVDRGRSWRVYAFYYALFLPLSVGPVLGGLAYVVTTGAPVPAWQFWTATALSMAWGIGCVAMERRVMGLCKG